jgi:hypothetical protein
MSTSFAAASDALARLDDGLQDPDDAELAAVLELHCQTAAFVPPVFCRHGLGPGCNSCFLDHDDAMRRAEDI